MSCCGRAGVGVVSHREGQVLRRCWTGGCWIMCWRDGRLSGSWFGRSCAHALWYLLVHEESELYLRPQLMHRRGHHLGRARRSRRIVPRVRIPSISPSDQIPQTERCKKTSIERQPASSSVIRRSFWQCIPPSLVMTVTARAICRMRRGGSGAGERRDPVAGTVEQGVDVPERGGLVQVLCGWWGGWCGVGGGEA